MSNQAGVFRLGLSDKYGFTWQVVPMVLPELLQNSDPATAGRVMQAMLTMKKIDIAVLQQAAANA